MTSEHRNATDGETSAFENHEAHLRQAQAVAGLGSWELDVTSDQLYWSKEVERQFDVRAEPPVSFAQFLEYVHPEDRTRVRDNWTAALDGDKYDVEHRIEKPDGDHVWVRARARIERDADGRPVKAVGVLQDITERKERESRMRMQLEAIESSMEGIAVLDADDEYVFMNQAHADLFGYDPGELVGRSWRYLYDDDEVERLEREVFPVVDDAGEWRGELTGTRRDGSTMIQETTLTRLDGGGLVCTTRDVTERKERERRLVSFEEATDDLATADTPEEAARTAVDAAENQLDLAAVGVFLYDGDDGVLEPEVGSNALPGEVQELRVGPSDGALWEAFATGTVISADRTDDDGPADVVSNAPWESLADFRAIPLGNHGVLFVAARDTALGPDTIQSAHVLGATLEAALNHLRGERQLASQEEKLRTETERAERLDRLARLTQRVEAAITEESGPAAIERAVCERLVDTGAYEMAWIGGVEVGTDRLTPGVVIGESTHHVTAMDLLTTDEAADRHPAIEAWRTDEVQAVNSLVGDGPAGEWRRHVLEQGYQSLCSVPLTYDGVTHGVLTIAAETPNVFAGREREVLGQLGTSIGHALAGIERRRALESDETVELEFCGDGTELPFARLAREGGCRVEHERTVRREDGDVSLYFTLDGDPPEDPRDTAERTLPGSVEVVRDEPGAGSVLLENVAESWFGSPLAEYGAVLRRAEATATDTTVLVELPARSDLRSFTDRLQDLAPSLELEAKRQHQQSARTAAELRNRIEERLTERQHEALQTAFTAGYFEWPRESDGGDVADRLDITQPTFNKHLRLAERKTFETLFEGEA